MLDTLKWMTQVAWVGLAGCSTTYTSVDRLLYDVRQDEAAVAANMRDQTIGLEGKVASMGRVSDGVAPALDLGNLELGDAGGYAVLGSPRGKPGRVLCLFEPSALDGLQGVSDGELVTLSCVFREVAGTASERVPVFEHCYVERQ